MSLDVVDVAWIAGGGVAVLTGWRIARRVQRWTRRRHAPRVNPALQQYADQADLARVRREEAAKIVATSSTGQIAGYDLVEQIEAVFVDGFRRPEEALEGLKAAAAMKGANGVINVHTERTAAGKCSARGDAVVIRKVTQHG